MLRNGIRELLRQAQEAELSGDKARAAGHLEEAARLHLSRGEGTRAAAILRHALRLDPQRDDLQEELAKLERGGAVTEIIREVAREVLDPGEEAPNDIVPVHDLSLDLELPKRTLEVPQRGPSVADPSLDAWCSFCCRPKAEVGGLVAGPAGAFICASCIKTAAGLAGVELAPTVAITPTVTVAADGSTKERMRAAVLLSRELGWSLTEVRTLSDEERAVALELLGKPVAARAKKTRSKARRR